VREFTIKNRINLIEIKLEDMAQNFQNEKNKLIDFIRLDDLFDNSIILREEKVNYYKERISDKENEFLHDKLSKFIKYYNY
jgi:hypothetical protein